MTELREISIAGPVVHREPLWKATIAVAYSGSDGNAPQPRPVVRKTQGIRVLVQDADTSQVRVGGQIYRFHKPRLLQAAVEPREDTSGDWRKLRVGSGGINADTVTLRDTRSDKLADVVLAPRDPAADWPAGADKIEVPDFTLVAGRIQAWLQMDPRQNNQQPGQEPWFGYDEDAPGGPYYLFTDIDHTSRLEVFARRQSRDTWLPVALTAEGITFLAKVPDPRQAFTGTARKIWAWVRLIEQERQPGALFPRYALAFVGACAAPQREAGWDFPDPALDAAHARELERGFHELFQDARQQYGIRVDFDERPSVPPFHWEMGLRANSSRPLFLDVTDTWSVQFDPALFRINVLSTIDGIAAAATLRCDRATLSLVRATPASNSSLTLESASNPSGGRKLSVSRRPDADWEVRNPDKKTFEAPRIVLDEIETRLKGIYAAAQLYAPRRDGAVQAFVPVEHGWLQLPLRPSDGITVQPALTNSVLEGDTALILDRGRGIAIEVDTASAGSLTLAIGRSPPRVTCPRTDLVFQDISGRMRGLLHLADCSPADGEILPTLRPGATREWPIRFGAGPTKGCLSAAGTDIVARSLTLDTKPRAVQGVEGSGLAWLRDGAWISTINLGQSQASGLPVAARSLVPRTLKNSCKLEWRADAALPAIAATSIDSAWALWTDTPPVTQLLPTLPGVERHGLTSGFTYTLRHDLPALDDLFASMQIEDSPLLLLGEKAPGQPVREPVATAAAPERLRDAWQVIRDNTRLTETRLRVAFSQQASGNLVDVGGLAEPYLWKRVPFSFAVDNGGGLSLGSYQLQGRPYAGGAALAGLQASGLVLEKGGAQIQVDIAGNATARWLKPQSDLLHDLAGMGIARTASLARSARVVTDQSSRDIALITAPAAVALEDSVSLWFRDIPFTNGVFDGSEGVDGFTADADTWSVTRFAQSLYEWRIWSSGPQDVLSGDIPLSLGFTARPLRLKRIERNAAGITRVEIVAAIVAPVALDASGESEAGVTAPARNLILITYAAIGPTGFTRTVVRIRIENGQAVPLGNGANDADRRRASFDVRPGVMLREDPNAKADRPGVLSFVLAADGSIEDARLTLALFGQAIEFVQDGWGSGGGSASLSFADLGSATRGTIDFKRCELSWVIEQGQDIEPATFVAAPHIELPFPVRNASASIGIDLWYGSISWFATIISNAPISYSHDRPEIRIGGGEPLTFGGSPVQGLTFATVSADGLFALDADRKLSGLLHLAASGGTGPGIAVSALRHSFVMKVGGWTNQMSVDLEGEARSSIQWPLDVRNPGSPRPEAEFTQPFTVEIGAGPVLTHHIRCTIRGAIVPVEALSMLGSLEVPWRVPMRVDHQLTGHGGQKAAWTSLDEATLADLRTLAGAPASPEYGFATRYKGVYRRTDAAGPPQLAGPGIVERTLAAAGFPDSMIRDALQNSPAASGLVVTGAGVSLIRPDRDGAGAEAESILLALPWLAGVGGATLGPLGVLRQAPATRKKLWRVAWFDTRVATLLPSAPVLPLSLGDASATIIAEQLAGRGEAVDRSLASTEQPFFENDDAVTDIAEAPLFLRSLVTLSSYWSHLATVPDLQARIVQPILRHDGSCALFTPTLKAEPRTMLNLVRAVSVVAEGVVFRTIDADLVNSVKAASMGMLRSLRDSLDPNALLFGLVSYRANAGARDLVGWEIEALAPIAVARRASGAGIAALTALRDPADRLFAAPSLGWPEPPAIAGGPFPLTLGDNRPFQAAAAAVAGRVTSYSAVAGAGSTGRPWLTRHQPVAFARAALPGTLGAAPRQHDIVPRRARLPLASDAPMLVPSRFATAVVGRRPGVAYGEVVALKSRGGLVKDVIGMELAARATLHPVIAGQDRMPRATVFPADVVDLDWRRETFVLPGGRKCRIDRVPSIAFRTYRSPDPTPTPAPAPIPASGTAIPLPAELVVLRTRRPVLDLEGATQLELLIDGPLPPDSPQSNNWRPYHWHEFRIRVGDRSWQLGAWTPLAGARGIALPILPLQAAQILEAARDASGDTVIACELDLAAQAPSAPGAPMAAPSLRVRLPLTIALTDRPRLAVEQSTLIFGDPAYDRMLSSMTMSDARRLGNALFIFAADRESYDRSTPILIGLCKQEQNGSASWPGFTAIVTWNRDGMDAVKSEPITAVGIAGLTLDQLSASYGLPSLLPGDRLGFATSYTDGSNAVELGVQLLVARDPVVPPAPAIYHLVTRHDSPAPDDAATALSASGPMPTLVEYGALEQDLISGYVRRRALFVWRFTPDSAPLYDRFGYLVKIDRSGAGQLPGAMADFEGAAS